MSEVNNTMDVIDSRDVIERIEELEEERENAAIHTVCKNCGLDIEGCEADDDWRDRGNNSFCWKGNRSHEPDGDVTGELPEDEQEELETLRALAEECEGYGDWQHGEALIRESYFEEYAEEMAYDIGAVDRNAHWPNNHIDWEAAAEELKHDYIAVDFDGIEYLMRA